MFAHNIKIHVDTWVNIHLAKEIVSKPPTKLSFIRYIIYRYKLFDYETVKNNQTSNES